MLVSCEKCVFCELVVREGDLFSFINPLGEEVSRKHESNILICRFNPPITGDWPQVSADDWCGKFQSPKEGEA